MVIIKKRIPLQVTEAGLIATAMVSCKQLRVKPQLMRFVVDTGSPYSFLSGKDVKVLQIPIKGKTAKEELDFGGSRFKKVELPKFELFLLKESEGHIALSVNLSALHTTKQAPKKIKTALMLPSILGMDFLRDQKFSLHVLLTENLAYLQYED